MTHRMSTRSTILQEHNATNATPTRSGRTLMLALPMLLVLGPPPCSAGGVVSAMRRSCVRLADTRTDARGTGNRAHPSGPAPNQRRHLDEPHVASIIETPRRRVGTVGVGELHGPAGMPMSNRLRDGGRTVHRACALVFACLPAEVQSGYADA